MTTYNIEDYIFTGDTSWPKKGEYYWQCGKVVRAPYDFMVLRAPIMIPKPKDNYALSFESLERRIKELEAELAAARNL